MPALDLDLTPVEHLSPPPWSVPVEGAVVVDLGPDRSGMLLCVHGISERSAWWYSSPSVTVYPKLGHGLMTATERVHTQTGHVGHANCTSGARCCSEIPRLKSLVTSTPVHTVLVILNTKSSRQSSPINMIAVVSLQ